MLGFLANNDANSEKLGLHGLSSLIFTVPVFRADLSAREKLSGHR